MRSPQHVGLTSPRVEKMEEELERMNEGKPH